MPTPTESDIAVVQRNSDTSTNVYGNGVDNLVARAVFLPNPFGDPGNTFDAYFSTGGKDIEVHGCSDEAEFFPGSSLILTGDANMSHVNNSYPAFDVWGIQLLSDEGPSGDVWLGGQIVPGSVNVSYITVQGPGTATIYGGEYTTGTPVDTPVKIAEQLRIELDVPNESMTVRFDSTDLYLGLSGVSGAGDLIGAGSLLLTGLGDSNIFKNVHFSGTGPISISGDEGASSVVDGGAWFDNDTETFFLIPNEPTVGFPYDAPAAKNMTIRNCNFGTVGVHRTLDATDNCVDGGGNTNVNFGTPFSSSSSSTAFFIE
jgi:hypothetical protein